MLRASLSRPERPVAPPEAGAQVSVVPGPDVVAVEEPLEIRLAGQPFLTTMRTPGADVELVHGLLLSEGIIQRGSDIAQMCYCGGACGANENTFNVLDVDFAPGFRGGAAAVPRRVMTTSACGICGTTSIEEVMARRRDALAACDDAGYGDDESAERCARTMREDAEHGDDESAERCARVTHPLLDARVLVSLPERLLERQREFARTGAVHGAGVFSRAGEALIVCEDVGRHNAVDKAIGALLVSGALPGPEPAILVVSGRASFELVQKAAMARLAAVVSVSAASSLAIDLAADAGMLLAGFTRDGHMNVYTGTDLLAD